jgi:uncharacterized protein YegJ (DUF2314 family)
LRCDVIRRFCGIYQVRPTVRYTLDDGEERHRDAPETFWIPTETVRNSLKPGQIVKLIFRIEVGDEVHVERMWVQVKERTPEGYLGELDNDPYCTTDLRAGEPVRFEPRHVINIEEEAPDA